MLWPAVSRQKTASSVFFRLYWSLIEPGIERLCGVFLNEPLQKHFLSTKQCPKHFPDINLQSPIVCFLLSKITGVIICFSWVFWLLVSLLGQNIYESILSKEGFVWALSLRGQSIVMGKSQQLLKPETTSAFGKQREMNAGALFTFSFVLTLGLQPSRRCCPHSKWGLPRQLTRYR